MSSRARRSTAPLRRGATQTREIIEASTQARANERPRLVWVPGLQRTTSREVRDALRSTRDDNLLW
jgi:hypothetical protein